MRIDSNSRAAGLAGRGSAQRAAGGPAFVPAGTEAPRQAGQVAGTAPTASLSALLALQAVEDPTQGRRKAVRRGASMLDQMEAIKADLLVGQVSANRLDQLMSMIAEERGQSEPGLEGVLDDIELRVRVELAKFGRFP
ncbi:MULTISPECIES: flagellar assembly protein FliX [unclassified Devosia]|uniref:flagellar assembly protein FliX n=1 Tax=unclassified Devosia TaxID=196773 RepID=UPI000FDC7710|nr:MULTISPECIES: flagellar assembly protein FliX [unclassified Devosia]